MEDSDWIKNYVSNDTEHHCNYNFTDERKKNTSIETNLNPANDLFRSE